MGASDGRLVFLATIGFAASVFGLLVPTACGKEPTMTAHVLYRTVKVDGLNIFYREAGAKDAPAILLLHGLPSSSRMFEPLLNAPGRPVPFDRARLSGLWT